MANLFKICLHNLISTESLSVDQPSISLECYNLIFIWYRIGDTYTVLHSGYT